MRLHRIGRMGLLGLLILAAGFGWLYRDQINVDVILHAVQRTGISAPLLFMAAYALAAVLFLPGVVFTLAGGALFGPIWGTVYSLSGATVGAALAFLLARYVAADWLSQRLHAKLPRLMRGIQAEDWKFVTFVRLVPVFPFNLLNYALGLTPIKFSHYVMASAVFMLPGAAAYSYLGHIGHDAATGQKSIVQAVLMSAAVLAVVGFLPAFIKKLRASKSDLSATTTISAVNLKQRLASNENIVVLDVRNPDEFSGPLGHIKGAINIALAALPSRLSELERWRTQPMAVVCLTDKRSTQAIQLLRDAGFANLILLRGGMKEWTSAKLPVCFNSPERT